MILRTILVSLLIFINFNIFNTTYAENPVIVYDMLDAIALSENTKKPIFIVFTAKWCSACRCIKKDIDTNPQLLDDFIICYIDYDTNVELVNEYKVKQIPDYFILKNRIETKRKVGYLGIEIFKKWLKHNE